MDRPPQKRTYRWAGLDLDVYEQSIAGMAPMELCPLQTKRKG